MTVADPLVELAARVGAACRAAGLTVATAESCTGGLVGHLLTEIPGSSAWFRGGLIAYADDVKEALLGVPAPVLAAHGAVSAQVALAMAQGALERPGADLAVAVTGIAGPGGGTDEKPVGLVYVGLATRAGATAVRREAWHHDRSGNKRASARLALELLLEHLPGGAG